MKKVNPKIIGLAVMLLSFLIAGSLSVQEGFGDPTLSPGDDGGSGSD